MFVDLTDKLYVTRQIYTASPNSRRSRNLKLILLMVDTPRFRTLFTICDPYLRTQPPAPTTAMATLPQNGHSSSESADTLPSSSIVGSRSARGDYQCGFLLPMSHIFYFNQESAERISHFSNAAHYSFALSASPCMYYLQSCTSWWLWFGRIIWSIPSSSRCQWVLPWPIQL